MSKKVRETESSARAIDFDKNLQRQPPPQVSGFPDRSRCHGIGLQQ